MFSPLPRCVLLLVWVSCASLAASPVLKVPPSGEWEAVADPIPQPGASDGQFFVWKKNHDVRLRVATFKALREDYSNAYVMAVSAQMGKQSRAAGGNLKVTEGVVFEVDGAQVAKMRTEDGSSQVLLYWLPGEEGDVVVSLMGANGAWDPDAKEEVEHAVYSVKHLRRRGLSTDEAAETAVEVAFASVVVMVVVGGLAAVALRRRRVRAS
jgi:hypothetical protein